MLTPSAGWAIAPQGFFYSTVWYFVMTTSSIYVGLITPIQAPITGFLWKDVSEAFAVDLDSTFLLVGGSRLLACTAILKALSSQF